MKSIMKEIKEINASNGRWVSKEQSKWLVDTIEKMNDALHNIQIITSTMEDTEQVKEIFDIADKSQLEISR